MTAAFVIVFCQSKNWSAKHSTKVIIMTTEAYKSAVSNWLNEQEFYAWKLASDSRDFDRIRNAMNHVSDSELYSMTKGLENDIRSNHERKEREKKSHRMMHLSPVEDERGVSFYDLFTGELVASMRRQENGLYSYLGPVGGEAEALFGRGGIFGAGGPYHQMADKKFFNYDSRKMPGML